ncbi:MAG: hypothetical protein OSB32_00305 [Candidatus Poseidoniales archaeon]|nr:hypothetical protein [Candidatus Poseidoniales archaeon]
MRGRAMALFFVLLGSLVIPFVPTTSASLEDLGTAGKVAELNDPSIGWWTLDNGNILVATSNGYVTAYSVQTNGSYAEVWTVDANTTLFGGAYNSVDKLLAVGTSSGVVVVSIEYMDELYRFSVGQSVDALAWDRDGDLWVTMRTSKQAIEWDSEFNTPSGISTSTHTNGITDVITLSDGKILTSGRDKQIRIHDENGTFLQVLANSTAPLLKLTASADESLLFSLTDTCKMDIHNTSSWAREHSLNLCSNGQGRSMNELGERFMVGMSNGKTFSVDLTTFSKEQEFSIQGEVVGFRAATGEGVYVLTSFGSSSEVHLLDADRDDDGVVDGVDVFPDDPTESIDSDFDGVGDNADVFPFDGTEIADSDGDNVGDNADVFPNNSAQQTDSDGDGYGDYEYGQDGDKFPSDSTQWADSDGDGYGDNQEAGATEPDACVNQSGGSTMDRLGCQDTDGDGWSDPGNGEEAHPSGNADAYLMEKNQWRDSDGDGYGDNLTGFRGDACPTLAGTSTRAILYDPDINAYTSINRYGCVDEDSDGYDDNTESSVPDGCTMVGNHTEWLDHDRDCAGSNSDYNDTDPEIQTLENHCAKHINDSACIGLDDDFDQDNLTYLEEESVDMMESVKEFAVIAAYLIGAMALAMVAIVGATRVIGRARDKRKPDAQYTHQDATRELDAWETGGEFETRGGIDEQKAWGDESLAAEEESSSTDDDDLKTDDESESEPDYIAEEMTVPDSSTDEIAEVEEDEPASGTTSEPSPQSSTQEQPAEAPPLPSGGLPEGWTMEQWRWYGHQWLEQNTD